MLKYNDLTKTQNSIKLTLALTDLLIGIFVVPSMFAIHYSLYFKKLPWYGFLDCPSLQIIYPRWLLNMFGFLQMFSITVSLYLLMFGSIDRLLAVLKPIEYSVQKYNYFKSLAFTFTFLISFGFSIYPVFFDVHDLNSYMNIGLLIVAVGQESLISISVILGVPLVIQWINGILILIIISKRNRRILNRNVLDHSGQDLDGVPKTSTRANTKRTKTSHGGGRERLSRLLNAPMTIRRPKKKQLSTIPESRDSGEIGAVKLSKSKRSKPKWLNRTHTLIKLHNKNHQEEIKATVTLSYMIGAFSLSILPVLVLSLRGPKF